MARKIRNCKPKAFYEQMLEDYFTEHKAEVIEYMLDSLGYEDTDALWEDERRMGFGFDCGWILLHPSDAEMCREWALDNGKYDVDIFVHTPYNTQSITVKRPMVQKALTDLELWDTFIVRERLD